MRGDAERQADIMLALTPDDFVPAEHPIRRIKPIVDAALQRLSPLFDTMYARGGRPSIPPEQLLKASLLIALYSVRSERQFCERLGYDLLFKWFLDLNIADGPFDASTFSKNHTRLLEVDAARAFFAEVVAEARRRRLLSAEHFTVDGTLLEAWASLKRYRPRDGEDPPAGEGRNQEVDFRGQRRRSATRAPWPWSACIVTRRAATRGPAALEPSVVMLGAVCWEGGNGPLTYARRGPAALPSRVQLSLDDRARRGPARRGPGTRASLRAGNSRAQSTKSLVRWSSPGA